MRGEQTIEMGGDTISDPESLNVPNHDRHVYSFKWNEWYNSLPETPIDPETGLPSCIVPSSTLAPVPGPGERNLDLLADWNHQFPKAEIKYSGNPVLNGLGSIALQNLRLQWVDYDQHHHVYNYSFKGPVQPDTPEKLFKTLVMGLAGSVPQIGLDLRGDSPREVYLSPVQRRMLVKSGQLKSACPESVHQYLFEYVFQQELDHIRFTELEEFLLTHDFDRRLYLGHVLVAKLVERAVEPIESLYQERRRANELGDHAPGRPHSLVKSRLAKKRFGPAIDELQRVLGSRRREVKHTVAA